MSDDKKKVIIFTVVGAVALVMGFFWVRSLPYYFEKISEGLGSSFGEAGSSFDFLGGASGEFSGGLDKVGSTMSELKGYLSDDQMAKLLAVEEEISKEEWKSYKNIRHGYEAQYPKEWIVDDSDQSAVKIFQFSPEEAGVFKKEAPSFHIYVKETEAGASLDGEVQNRLGREADFFIKEKAVIDGTEGLLICKDSRCDPLEMFFFKENRFYNFSFKTDLESDPIRQGIIFQRIINSFKFTR